MKVPIVFLLITLAQTSSLAELMGMGYLLENLTLWTQNNHQFIGKTKMYMLDQNINTFLTQFKTRTDFCQYKCEKVHNFPCFLLFQCNIHIRNFFILMFLPIFMLGVTGICCGKGCWTFSCWIKYISLFTFITFFKEIFKKIWISGLERSRKLHQIKVEEQYFKNNPLVQEQNQQTVKQ